MLRKESEKKLRAFAIMKRVIGEGASKKAVAREMGISHDTVERTMKWAEDAKLFVEYEQRLFTELLPLAVSTAKSAMEDGDATVAMKIMDMVEKKATKGGQGNGSEHDGGGLWAEVEALRSGRVIDVSPAQQAGTEEYVVPDGVSTSGVYGQQAITAGEGETGGEVDAPATEGAQE